MTFAQVSAHFEDVLRLVAPDDRIEKNCEYAWPSLRP